MFGFIASPCARCTSAEFPFWRGTFCGLARVLAREYSAPARLLVNRDATFLALLGLSLDPESPNWKNATCCNPLATPFPVDDQHPAVAHAAAVTVCGLATKLDDDHHDEGGIRKYLSRFGSAIITPAVDLAIARLNSTNFPTHDVIQRLKHQEVNEHHSPLRADESTAASFGLITAHLAELLNLPTLKPELEKIGAAHGRLVYWRDAWDDQNSDLKKGRFNPYFHLEKPTIQGRIEGAWHDFSSSLQALPYHRHSQLLTHLTDHTARRHGEFLSSEASSKDKKKKRKKDHSDHCCHHCDCCGGCDCCHSSSGSRKGGACDACFDCGPGDKGCIDCCPCDGCDCCPCN
ncbi:DUF5685 family protein [Haloferula chungangensis]|uniref:DUF5685 family protein n=1 Tax=Haloferula chungangensis TaxID=1048331 RepID=A0ABW2L896_9BACT